MDSFYLTVLSIASVILILALTYVGILLYYSERSEVFPPLQNACPDYWYLEPTTGKCRFPVQANSKNRGNYTATVSETASNTEMIGSAAGVMTGVKDGSLSSGILTPNTLAFDMNHAAWETNFGKRSALCNKKYWANLRGITWDGVTNTNQC